MDKNKNSDRPLQKMFMAVPPSYDLLNRLLTFRFDEVWRKKAAAECMKNNPENVLDLCCGTGDLVLRLKRMARPETKITALDYSEPMLQVAKLKAKRKDLTGIEFIHGDAANMPFPDNYFDSIGIAFAFRNLSFYNPDREKFIAEILRVLKSNGSFVIVETSQPKSLIMRKFFHWYMRWITAPLGGLISGHYGAYKYLAHSASHYYNGEEMTRFLIDSGFTGVKTKTFMTGIASLYVATK